MVTEWNGRMTITNKEGRKNYRSVKNGLKRAIVEAKNECVENICEKIMEVQRTGRYDLMYLETKE